MKDYIKKRIESYRNSDDKRPLIVDVSTIDDLQALSQQYLMLKRKSVFELVKSDSELPSTADIYQFLDTCNDDFCFVYGLGTYLRLKGKDEFKKTIHSLLGTAYATKFIIVTYQCNKFFDEKIPKYKENIIMCGDDIISSPSSINKGTLTSIPVSIIASLVALVAVFPFIPGSVLVILKSF